MAARSEHTELPWSTLTSTGMFLLVVVGAFWALAFGPIQDKFGQVEKRSEQERGDLLRVQENLKSDIRRIDAELMARRDTFVGQPEFKQVVNRLETLANRLQVIESTRPTTGELSAVAGGTKDSLSVLESRIRALEATTPRLNNPTTVH